MLSWIREGQTDSVDQHGQNGRNLVAGNAHLLQAYTLPVVRL
jgi:hypothetical protein